MHHRHFRCSCFCLCSRTGIRKNLSSELFLTLPRFLVVAFPPGHMIELGGSCCFWDKSEHQSTHLVFCFWTNRGVTILLSISCYGHMLLYRRSSTHTLCSCKSKCWSQRNSSMFGVVFMMLWIFISRLSTRWMHYTDQASRLHLSVGLTSFLDTSGCQQCFAHHCCRNHIHVVLWPCRGIRLLLSCNLGFVVQSSDH